MSIEVKNLEHVYGKGTPFEHKALNGISLKIPEGKVTAIIGQTGSGKSTLVQHLNGLLKPTAGEVVVNDFVLKPDAKNKDIKKLRRQVGLVFQFPEYQLFEETIAKDIGFGPKNFGESEEEIDRVVKKTIKQVGLDESFLERSPFELSGGQKRRVAIAGILAIDPDILVLDEPAAGLDPQSALEMMNLFMDLNKKEGKTIILVSHDMEHVMKFCDEVIVLENGDLKIQTDVKEFFKHPEWLDELKINPPKIVEFKRKLKEAGFEVDDDCFELEPLLEQVERQLTKHE